MELVRPSTKYKDTFIEAVKEYHKIDSSYRRDIYDLKIEDLEKDFDDYVLRLLSYTDGKNQPIGYVPETVFWFIDDGEFIGRISIRHELTESLLRDGGHIGYDIRPSKRKRGYGTKMLGLALVKAKELGLNKVLLTCDEDNIASKKIIEANGGIFENVVERGEGKPKKLRYWITL